MRPRYVRALRDMLEAFEARVPIQDIKIDSVSELKGMVNRCLRRDQWDWFSVYLAFGRPRFSLLRQAASLLEDLSRLLRASDWSSAEHVFQVLGNPDLLGCLRTALGTIKANVPHLQEGRKLGSPQPMERDSDRRNDTRQVTTTYTKAKLDRAIEDHAEILSALVAFLESNGHLVERSDHIDAFSRLRSGPAIFEAKSIHPDNELAQVRSALSQLYEYRYRSGETDASLWIALSRPPQQRWLIDYLERDRGIHLIWLEGDRFAGPSAGLLTESGIAALKRRSENEKDLR